MLNVNELIGFGAGGSGDEHRYWRLLLGAPSLGSNIATEIELRDAGGTELSTNNAQASSDTGTAANAFDNNTGTTWSAADTIAGHWLAYDFVSQVDIAQVYYLASMSFDYGPSSITLQYADASAGPWTDVKTWSGLTWSYGVAQTFTV